MGMPRAKIILVPGSTSTRCHGYATMLTFPSIQLPKISFIHDITRFENIRHYHNLHLVRQIIITFSVLFCRFRSYTTTVAMNTIVKGTWQYKTGTRERENVGVRIGGCYVGCQYNFLQTPYQRQMIVHCAVRRVPKANPACYNDIPRYWILNMNPISWQARSFLGPLLLDAARHLGGYLETSVTRTPTEAAPHPSRTEISTAPMGQTKSLIFIHVSVLD